MAKLLIADRDQNERIGIKWLLSSYSIPFHQVLEAGTISEIFHLIESEKPEVVCIKLDMIPTETWDSFRRHHLYLQAEIDPSWLFCYTHVGL